MCVCVCVGGWVGSVCVSVSVSVSDVMCQAHATLFLVKSNGV